MDTRTDAEVTADVYSAIHSDPAVSVMDFEVITSGGHVTLDGTTSTLASKDGAQRAAYRVAGVRAVTNAIAVDPEALGIRTDERIRVEVHTARDLDTLVPLNALSVAVNDGIVTLSGSVENEGQRELAGDDTRQVPGVRRIVNLITVKPQEVIA